MASSTDVKLEACPDSPNCVSTEADPGDAEHYLPPVAYTSEDATMAKLIALLSETPRTRIITQTEDYVHAEVRSRIFRFVDDVEVYLDSASKLVRFRSAARTGHSDFGVNRKRMKTLSEKLR